MDNHLEEASDLGCHACASPGGGCQFLGTAATSQVVAEALGLSVTHSALAPSGQPIWLDMAKRSAHALIEMGSQKITTRDILTEDFIITPWSSMPRSEAAPIYCCTFPPLPMPQNCRAHHRGLEAHQSTNSASRGCAAKRTTGYGTVQVFLAGGVPEVMLHLRELGLLKLSALTVNGCTLDEALEKWEGSERRQKLRQQLQELDG